ncbi:hypothetical protein EVAR_27634_1 [Eumeta japonica]|uniref:Uncharacterized protein n=1 Tax=Eumeta variegata TaxID=151549 RepID=A0A4C1V120_EUMVA|nr:hypothetical protein EVAR_27634_1 [Eumeta japonica]
MLPSLSRGRVPWVGRPPGLRGAFPRRLLVCRESTAGARVGPRLSGVTVAVVVVVAVAVAVAIRSDELNAAAGGYTGSPWPPLELDPVGWGRKLYPPGAPRSSGFRTQRVSTGPIIKTPLSVLLSLYQRALFGEP